jgi:hypothetical protein
VATSLLLFGLVACKRPPEAPAGLTESLTFLLREFQADDDTVGAGLTGVMNWFDEDGAELLDAEADLDSVGAFQLDALTPGDVERLPVDGEPDVALAPGVVSVAEMPCRLARAQELLLRADQDVVFEGTWRSYDRTFVTPRAPWEDAPLDEVGGVREDIVEDDLGAHPDALLATTNAVVAKDFGMEIGFDLDLRLRHGRFAVQGEPTEALLILSFLPRPSTEVRDSAIVQSWSIEMDLARAGGRTLRVFGAWSQLESPFLAADSAMVLTTGVNEAQQTAERMSSICAGELEIPPE